MRVLAAFISLSLGALLGLAAPAGAEGPRPCCAAQGVVAPGVAQADDAVTPAAQARLTSAVRRLWAARKEATAVVEVRFPDPSWHTLKVAVAEHGRRVCKTAQRLPVLLVTDAPGAAPRPATLWRAEGQDRLTLEVEAVR